MRASVILAALFTTLSAQAQTNPVSLERCARLVQANSRCEQAVSFDASKNLVELKNLGTSTVCDDGKTMSFRDRLKDSDVASMLLQDYTPGPIPLPVTEVDFSPGGLRNQDFLKAIYGASEDDVRKNLVTIDFLGQKIRFNHRNGAAYQLSLVGSDLMALYTLGTDAKLNAFLKPFILPPGASASSLSDRCNLVDYTFDWRFVKGTTSLSNHSFGAAIDMQPASGHEYWLWDIMTMIREGRAQLAPGADVTNPDLHDVLNFVPVANPTYPQKLVEVFEKHGFIWGGKWYRYDIMHFEFRPEFYPSETLACAAK